MKNKILAILALGMLAGPMAANAVPVTWTLDGVFFQEAQTGFGSFVYDAQTGLFSSISLSTSGGRTYTDFLADSGPGLVFLQAGVTSGSTIALSLDSIFRTMLTDAGGVLAVNPPGNVARFAEFNCSAPTGCAPGFGSVVTNWYPGGVSTLTGVPNSVPEPGTLALLGLGLLGLGFSRRRKQA